MSRGASRGNLTRTGRGWKGSHRSYYGDTYDENRWLKSYCCKFFAGISASRENAKTLFVAGVSAAPRGPPGLLPWFCESTALCDLVYGAVRE